MVCAKTGDGAGLSKGRGRVWPPRRLFFYSGPLKSAYIAVNCMKEKPIAAMLKIS
jgi:hypothetical protein